MNMETEMELAEASPRRTRRRQGKRRAEPRWVIPAQGNQNIGYGLAKRAIDLMGALALLTILSPLMLVLYLALTIYTGGKAIFSQQRVGRNGRLFTMYKFRSMRLDAERIQHLVANDHRQGPIFKSKVDPRITPIGKWMRKYSIDELPQLINVLRGEMSLVGPRPPIAREVDDYARPFLARLAVKPGLTCLWQVKGRSDVQFEEWMVMDRWYVRNQCLSIDLWLLAMTPFAVALGKGAY